VLGTMLAGVAGVVGSPILRSIDPNTYSLAVFVAIAAAVVGGFRSVGLAFVGAIFVAVASNLTFSYATFAESIPGFNSTVPFLLLIAGLLLMARSRARVAGSIAAEPPAPDYQRDLPRWRRMLLPVLGCVALVYLVFSLLGTYWLGLTTRGLIFSLIFLSFTIVTGVGGMVSLAQAAFVSGAGLLAGALITRFDLPWGIGALGAVVASMALGALVALPSLRLGGVALALATLALAFVGGMVVFQIDWIRNGEFGWTYTRPVLGPFHLDDTRTMAAFLMLLIAAVVLLIRNLERSTSGREMLAVRNAPAAAASIGISPTATKLKVFALSAGVAGLGGVLLATNDLSFTSSSINPTVGLLWLAGVVLLGIRKPAGAIAAGLVYTLMPGLLGGFTLPFDLAHWSGTRAAEVPIILFGLGAIALARQPDGIFQEVAKKNYERRERRRRRRDATSSTVDAAPNALDQTDRVVPVASAPGSGG
jgi:ABC-type branched-subunit amino acid transport system permease subunit